MNEHKINVGVRIGAACSSILIALAAMYVMNLAFGPSPFPVAKAEPIGVGLVTDVNGLNDTGFNWLSYQGLIRAQNELGITPEVYTPSNDTEFEAKLQQCAEDGNVLCIGANFLLLDAVANTASIYTGTNFAIVDAAYESYPANLRGITFSSEEVGYLAGTLAGLMTQSDIVGDIGGMEIPPVTAFTLGYRNGTQCANPSASVLITYTNDFGNPDLGAQAAQQMIAQGADVIFAAAGQTGVGAVLTATQSGVWGIGVDTDFYITVFDNGAVPGADYLLSSAMKHVDNGVYLTIRDVISGTFTSGTVIYNLEDGGVGLAPFHQTDALVPASVKNRIELVRRGIIAGVIDANSEICPGFLFLPRISR